MILFNVCVSGRLGLAKVRLDVGQVSNRADANDFPCVP